MSENIELMMPIKAAPYDHQKRAFAFACDKFGVFDGRLKSRGTALLMEMGTGKTIVSIAVAGCMYQYGLVNRVLVVAPLSILGVWEEEFEKFADFPYSLTVLKGTSAKKKEQLNKLQDEGLQVVVVNYESAWRLEKELMAYNADLVIADEAHKLKENRTSQSKGMHHIGDKARYKLLLTGTVITNRELDVFSQYRFLNPQIFGTSFYAFRNQYFDMGGYGNHTPIFRKWMTDDFLKRLHSVAFRVTKAECLDLPAITEEVRTVDLEKDAIKLYDSIEDESYAELDESEVTTANILTRLLRLSQITGGHLTDDDGVVNTVSRAKLDALSDIIDSAMAEDKKLVIMARFVPELDDIQELLEKKKIGYAVVRGGVKDRDNEIHRFQYDDRCRVFVGQIAAAGLGITLTAASTMVFYSLDYSMSNFEQAKARIHRAGQKENCHYIYVSAYNQLVTEKKEIIANAEIIRKTLCVTDSLQEEKGKLEEEMVVLVEMTQNIVAENARVAQNQDEYQKRYDGLVQRYDTAKARYDEVVAAISAKEAQSERLADFIKVLKAQDGTISEFDGSLWGGMVEFITVSRDKKIKVTFRDGTEILVE